MLQPQVAFTMNDAMSALRISRATIYQLINEQKLKTYKIGRRRYCSFEALTECQRRLEADTGTAA